MHGVGSARQRHRHDCAQALKDATVAAAAVATRAGREKKAPCWGRGAGGGLEGEQPVFASAEEGGGGGVGCVVCDGGNYVVS